MNIHQHFKGGTQIELHNSKSHVCQHGLTDNGHDLANCHYVYILRNLKYNHTYGTFKIN